MARFAFTYLWAGYRRRSAVALRTLVLATLVTAGVFFFAAVLPAVSFKHTAALQAAKWDVVASSSGATAVPEPARVLLGREGARFATCRTTTGDASAPGDESTAVTLLLLDPAETASSGLSWYAPDLLVDGSAGRGGLWMDALTARQLGVRVGDTVAVRFVALVDGAPRTFEATRPLTALFAPTLQTSGVCLPVALPAGTDLPVDLFVGASSGSTAIGPRLRPALDEGWSVRTRADEWSAGRRQVDEAINRNTRFSLIWISIAVYVGYAWREMEGRFRVRRHDFAVLLSIGSPVRSLLGIAIAEQLAYSLISAVAGFSLGAWALVGIARLWVPNDTYLFLAGYVVLANAIVLALAARRYARQLRELPVASLLSEE